MGVGGDLGLGVPSRVVRLEQAEGLEAQAALLRVAIDRLRGGTARDLERGMRAKLRQALFKGLAWREKGLWA